MKNNEKTEKAKEETREKIKNEKKPAIVIQVPGFGSSNSGPGPARRDIPEEDADD